MEFTIFQNVLLKQDKNQKFRTGTQLQSRKFLAESKSEEPQQERKEANCLQTMRWLFEFSSVRDFTSSTFSSILDIFSAITFTAVIKSCNILFSSLILWWKF